MTSAFFNVIVTSGKNRTTGPERKAMLHFQMIKNEYRPNDLLGKFMPSADKAEWLKSVCLTKTGSSGYLIPHGAMRILE